MDSRKGALGERKFVCSLEFSRIYGIFADNKEGSFHEFSGAAKPGIEFHERAGRHASETLLHRCIGTTPEYYISCILVLTNSTPARGLGKVFCWRCAICSALCL